jgi:hypothetical protein
MTLDDIATLPGKGGLFRVFKPAKAGVILESLDDAKTKTVATPNHRLSILSEISIYTHSKEGTLPLVDVLAKIHAEFEGDIGLDSKAEPAELKSFMKSVLSDYDEDRVYVSDIKKLVKWYDILVKFAPEVLVPTSEKSGSKEDSEEKVD